jgi:hypothetical protein
MDAQHLEDLLAHLPLDFGVGSAVFSDCAKTSVDVSWSDWIAKCKDSTYTPLKALLDADLQTATAFTSDSDNVKAIKKQIAIVFYWNSLFSTLGLRTDLDHDGLVAVKLSGFAVHRELKCGTLFNQTSNTAVNIVTADLGPTLSGNDPTIKAQSAFATVSCTTPFAVSAGVGFSTIEQKQFAIVKSPDGKGGTVSTFGTTSDSKVTPVALAVAHVRIHEWLNHKVGFYGSLGIGGNLQNQSSSSPVQFLPGVSFALWRTMYLTAGAEIGNQTSLAGGFKEGDPVPAGIDAITGLTTTSYTTGFGFAITFTKP